MNNPQFVHPTMGSEKQLLNMSQQSQSSTRKKGITEFNQIYKQIPTEKERRKFLLLNALPLSKEQAGCRKLQKKIEEELKVGNNQFCEELLTNLIDFFPALMKDQFANYLCQKLIKIAPSPQLDKILNVIRNDFIQIAMD